MLPAREVSDHFTVTAEEPFIAHLTVRCPQVPSECCAFMLCVWRSLLAADALFLLGRVCADPGEGRRDREGRLAVDGQSCPSPGRMENKQEMQICAIASPELQLK